MNTHDFVTTWILRSTYVGMKNMNSNNFSTIFMLNLRFNRFVHILTYIYISNVWNQLLSPKCRSFSLNFDKKNYQLYFKATYCLSYLDNFLVISVYISISYVVSILSPMYRQFSFNFNTNLNQLCRYRSEYGFSQWETTLQCNVVSHWLSPYSEWPLLCSKAVRCLPYVDRFLANRKSTCYISDMIIRWHAAQASHLDI